MEGTIRTLDLGMQKRLFERFRSIVENTAKANGAEAILTINEGYPITYNDPDLVDLMDDTFMQVAGADKVDNSIHAVTGAEDFSFFQEKVPGLYFFIGGMPRGMNEADAAPHHTPDFFVDDEGLLTGIRLMSRMVVDYAEKNK